MIEFLNGQDIRRELGMSKTKYERMRRAGQIPLRRLGERPCMTREDFDNWIRNLPFETPPAALKVTA